MGNCQGQSWYSIHQQFEGKKSLEDIVLQFMQFPITNFDPHDSAQRLTHGHVDYAQ
jgi:hypothetical protein